MDEAGLVGSDHRLRPVVGVELGEDAADVGLDRFVADEEVAGNLGVGASCGDQPQDVDLAGGEIGDSADGVPRSDADELVDQATGDVGGQ